MSINITLRQAKALVEFFGGHDCEVTIADYARGLLAYCSEYPDEGGNYIGDTEVDDNLAINGEPAAFDLIAHLHRQREFSERTFGPGARLKGVTDHITKELIEVRDSGGDLSEWVDVILLALDGAWRSGATPEQIATAISTKQTKNEGRNWPDWRTAPADTAIEHDRTGETA
ncbi:MAG TPA: dATP/dGTP pyrophosphohydrolase domain-containing protein [Rhodocyclaceae bacterium]|jgi:hypothetical protein